ncbi:MAG: sigma-70 family RNA polymerase sigma factor, partial [Candidatus Marinimicrobia bacterium]|nr:sigma-70 family RNA polymerase sigma factor [Candidatus Neomarinimicrobiota bacterium]
MKAKETKFVRSDGSLDPDAFKTLVTQRRETMLRLAYQLTGDWDEAEDISQQVFIKAYHGLHRFRGDSGLSSWLYRIMVNTYLDHKRQRLARGGRHASADELVKSGQADPFVATAVDEDPVQATTADHARRHIAEALESLAPRQRSIFVMRHYHDLPLKEIASILHVSLGTVKSQLFRAVRRLRQ